MIARLRGILAAIGDDHAIVDVAGVGYLVTVAPATLERLPRVGEAVELHTELQLREDGMTLYGFPDPADRTWFRLLQTVQGVGARVALSLLGTLRPNELANAIAAGDKAMLSRATGVGGRLAARIASELKDRVGALPQAGHSEPAGAVFGRSIGRRAIGAPAPRLRPRRGLCGARSRACPAGGGHRRRRAGARGAEGADGVTDRIVSPAVAPEDGDVSLRPRRLAEFIGQAQLRSNLAVFIEAAGTRGDALDHVLFAGPPGLGKTTLAQIVAAELGVGFRLTSGPIIARAGDLAAILTNLQPRDVLFIDEIHRLQPAVEEILYPAMEDYKLDLMIGEGPAARSIRLDLPPFTLVGATTRTGLLTTPLRDRFGIVARLEFYEVAELEAIVLRGARLLGLELLADAATEIARRARGTPRVATRLLRRVRDFATVDRTGRPVDAVLADKTLRQLEVDDLGLDSLDRRYLRAIALNYGGGPVGIDTMAAALSEQRDTLEETVEPYLLQQGLLQRTPRGRLLTRAAWRHLGLSAPAPAGPTVDLFGGEGP